MFRQLYERQGGGSGKYSKGMHKDCVVSGSQVFCLRFKAAAIFPPPASPWG